METKDYYKILEVNENASKEDIKKSYRNLAIKWHPDKNKDPDALQKFKDISEAYQVLYDKDKRNEYDNIRNYKQSNANYSTAYANHSFDFVFPVKDPFEIFNEVFSIISGIHNSIMAFDSLMQFNNGRMSIHVIDMENSFSDMSDDITNILNVVTNKFINNNQQIKIKKVVSTQKNKFQPEMKPNCQQERLDISHINQINHQNQINNINKITKINQAIQSNNIHQNKIYQSNDSISSNKWNTEKGNGYIINILNNNDLDNIIKKSFSNRFQINNPDI